MTASVLRTGRVLVVGASGQLGDAFATALTRRGVEAVTACRAPGRGTLTLDLADPEAAARQVATLAPSVVLNAAAYTAVDRAETEPELARRVNAEAPAAIARACRDCDALLVHVSTDYVFDGDTARPYREDDPARPVNEYGRGKLAGEQAVRASGAAHLVVRTSGLYAPGGANFVATMQRLFRGAKPVGVVNDQKTSPTCVQPLAESLVGYLDGLSTTEASGTAGTYHLCAEGEASWYEFACAIHAATLPEPTVGLHPISTADFGAPAPRPARSTLDCGLARERLGLALPHWREQLDAVMPAFNRLVTTDAG